MFGKYHSISIKHRRNSYFIYICTECNPNNIPTKSFTTSIGNCHKKILEIVETEIKKLLKTYGTPKNDYPYYFVSDYYWSKNTHNKY